MVFSICDFYIGEMALQSVSVGVVHSIILSNDKKENKKMSDFILNDDGHWIENKDQ